MQEPSRAKRIRWSLVISSRTPISAAQAIIKRHARVTVTETERSTPKRRATTAVSRRLIPIITAVINPKMAPVSTSLTASHAGRSLGG